VPELKKEKDVLIKVQKSKNENGRMIDINFVC